MGVIWSGISSLIKSLLGLICFLLPKSPFISILNFINDIPYLSLINWFIPFDLIIGITEIWLVAVGGFYTYTIILRWVKAIE